MGTNNARFDFNNSGTVDLDDFFLFAGDFGKKAGEGVKSITVTLPPGEATMEMLWIEPGEFLMGSPASEWGRYPIEGPQHNTTIISGFYLGKCNTTAA